jgi:hypothetical protein
VNDWPVRFILAGPAWQRGYDRALDLADRREELSNPFDPSQDEFYGFEEGRCDAEKIERLRGNEVSDAPDRRASNVPVSATSKSTTEPTARHSRPVCG